MNTYTVFVIDNDFMDFQNPETFFLRFGRMSPEDIRRLAGLCIERGMDVVIRLEEKEEPEAGTDEISSRIGE